MQPPHVSGSITRSSWLDAGPGCLARRLDLLPRGQLRAVDLRRTQAGCRGFLPGRVPLTLGDGRTRPRRLMLAFACTQVSALARRQRGA